MDEFIKDQERILNYVSDRTYFQSFRNLAFLTQEALGKLETQLAAQQAQIDKLAASKPSPTPVTKSSK